jgi:hypothetical protein
LPGFSVGGAPPKAGTQTKIFDAPPKKKEEARTGILLSKKSFIKIKTFFLKKPWRLVIGKI